MVLSRFRLDYASSRLLELQQAFARLILFGVDMKIYRGISAFFLAALLLPFPVRAQTSTDEMRAVYAAFEKLQIYLAEPQKFEDPNNRSEVRALLVSLSDGFKKADHLSTKFKNEVGFNASLSLVQDILSDAIKRFDENKPSYSLWRVRGVSNNCVACHSTHNIPLSFQANSELPAKLTPFERGNFYLATRQFSKADAAYVDALQNKEHPVDTLEVLRKWLIVQTHAGANPKHAYQALEGLTRSLKLSSYEKDVTGRWLKSLQRWASEKSNTPTFGSARTLITKAISSDPLDPWTDDVSLLRAAAQLQGLLPSLKASEHSQALYLLGASYLKLSPYFIEELPEFYLRLCIEEAPGSEQAKSAYKLYQDSVTAAFSGSHGSRIPSDIQVLLMEMYAKAYGIPSFDGKI